MFGSNDNNDQNQPAANPALPTDNKAVSSFTMDPPKTDLGPAPLGSLPKEPTASPTSDATTAPHLDDSAIQPGASGLNDNAKDDEPSNLPPAIEPPTSSASDSSDDNSTSPSSDDLISIKQQALTQLSPIVQHLDQTPEDKFKTLMMMIQANDNQALIKDAYEAAQQITDEKAKSQALLDVVNEINYFTQKDKDDI